MNENRNLSAILNEAIRAMVKLGIRGTTVRGEVANNVAKTTFKFPNTRTYFLNSKRIHDREVELMDKYPDVKFDFDIDFQK
jgi:hypothetical protein